MNNVFIMFDLESDIKNLERKLLKIKEVYKDSNVYTNIPTKHVFEDIPTKHNKLLEKIFKDRLIYIAQKRKSISEFFCKHEEDMKKAFEKIDEIIVLDPLNYDSFNKLSSNRYKVTLWKDIETSILIICFGEDAEEITIKLNKIVKEYPQCSIYTFFPPLENMTKKKYIDLRKMIENILKDKLIYALGHRNSIDEIMDNLLTDIKNTMLHIDKVIILNKETFENESKLDIDENILLDKNKLVFYYD